MPTIGWCCATRAIVSSIPAWLTSYQPGLAFEQMLRTVAERGIVADAVERPQEWIARETCSASQPWRTASASQSDGRWIQISERKTQDGGTVGVFTDVTELKRAEEALREKTEFLALNQVITAAANEAAGVESAIQIALDQVCAQTRWPVGHAYMLVGEELVTSRVWHLDDSERFETFRRVSEATRFGPGDGLPGRVLSSGKPAWITDVTKDRNFPRAQMATDLGVKGAFGFPVLVGKDVVAVLEFFSERVVEPHEALLDVAAQIGTQLGRVIERQRAEGQLREAKDEAEAATQAKSQFLASMSHELRTPLNAIIGYSEMLHEEAEDLGQDAFLPDLEKIRDAGKHLLSLINDILDLSKIEAGKMDVLLEDFEVADLIAEVQSVIQPLMAKNANTLVVDCAPDLGAMRSDQTKLRQNLFNLLSNAAKFTEQGTDHARGAADRPGRARLAGVQGLGHRHRHDRGAARPAVPGVRPGRSLDLARLRRHRARPRHHQALLPDAGRRRRGREHARPGLDLHDHAAGHRPGCEGRGRGERGATGPRRRPAARS